MAFAGTKLHAAVSLQDEATRIRMFYQHKLLELARKNESKARCAQQMCVSTDCRQSTRYSPLNETSALRAENEVLKIRLQEFLPHESWTTQHEVTDLVQLRRQAAAAEKYRVQVARQADHVKMLTKKNEELCLKLEEKSSSVPSHLKIITDPTGASRKLEHKLQILEERMLARERHLQVLLDNRDGDLLEQMQTEQTKFIARLGEKNDEIVQLRKALDEALQRVHALENQPIKTSWMSRRQ